MPASIGDVMVLIAPTWVAILELWRRTIASDSDTEVNEDSIEDIEKKVDSIKDEMASEAEIRQVMAMMDTLHDDVEIVHDSVIDHNPCPIQQSTGRCPYCTPETEK